MNEPIQMRNFSERYPKTEKIDGEIYMMSAPCDEHIYVQGNLVYTFTDYFKRNKRKCRIMQDAKTDIDANTFVKPDLKILCKGSNNGEIPVIVIEILSRSTRDRDLGVKMKKYAELGVKEYWIITWEIVSIDIYLLNEEKKYDRYKSYVYYSSENELKDLDEDEKEHFVKEFSPVSFPELTVKLEDVFDIEF